MAQQLAELKRLAKRLGDGPVVCGGTLALPRRCAQTTGGISVCYTDQQSQLHSVDFPSASDDELQALVSACTPATFGRGSEEVLDPAYRQAVRLDPSRFTTSLNLAEFPILAEIRRLFGSEITDVRAQLYKLNVYATGGFFKAHRDTPRSSQLIGTLVVCLPTQFEGGELLVKDACDDTFAHTFDWAKNPQNGLQWCAFYADSEHEVLPVTSGYRVTLTYLLEHQAVAPLGTQLDAADARVFTAFGEKLEADLKDPTFAPQGTKLGFGLKHQYIIGTSGASWVQNANKRARVGDATGDATVPLLKGVDCILKQTLDRLGLRYAFVPVYKTEAYDNWLSGGATNVEEELAEDDPRYYGYKVPAPTEWKFPFRVEGKPQGEWRGDDERRLFVSDWNTYVGRLDTYFEEEGRRDLDFGLLNLHKSRKVVWVVPPSVFPYEKTSVVYGNEAVLGYYYAAACFIVYVPPSARRSAAPPAENP